MMSFGERFPFPTDRTINRGGSTTAANTDSRRDVRASSSSRDRKPVVPPPSHPAATREVGKLLDLGLALGHQRFELVSLAERDDAGMVAAHAWAETRDGDLEYPEKKNDPSRSATNRATGSSTSPVTAWSRPRPSTSHSVSTSRGGRDEIILREAEWLRERVDNLGRELVVARRDSGRLAKQLKHEEEIGREQRRRADEAVREATALREEVERLKEARSTTGSASRAALSDAHDRSVRMAERRRRQQAESLMQAYKQLYEDQLQTQQAAAESYRSLTRGYSRLSADNKALRKAMAAGVAAPAPAMVEAADTHARTTPQTVTTQQILVRGLNTAGEGAARRTGAATISAPSVSEAGDGDAVAQHAATASESAAAVATAAEAVAAAAGALAVAASSNDNDDDDYNAGQHQRRHGDSAGREKGPGRVGKSRTSPTDSASTAETLACSPFGDEESEVAVAASVAEAAPCKRPLSDDNTAARCQAQPAPSSTVGGAIVEKDVSANDSAVAQRCGVHGGGCTSTEAYAFPRTGGPSSPPKRQPPQSDDDWERSADQSPGEKPLFVAVPPTDRDPRWRGRSVVGQGRAVASSASWAEAVNAPKRSSSPAPPVRGRWGACGRGGGWRTQILGGGRMHAYRTFAG